MRVSRGNGYDLKGGLIIEEWGGGGQWEIIELREALQGVRFLTQPHISISTSE